MIIFVVSKVVVVVSSAVGCDTTGVIVAALGRDASETAKLVCRPVVAAAEFCGVVGKTVSIVPLMIVATVFEGRGVARDILRVPGANFGAEAFCVTVDTTTTDLVEVTVV